MKREKGGKEKYILFTLKVRCEVINARLVIILCGYNTNLYSILLSVLARTTK